MRNDEIYKLLELQGENFDLKLDKVNETIEGGLKGVRIYVASGFETIDRLDKARNDRIGKNEEGLKEIKKETTVSRWMHRNPGRFTAGVAIVAMIFLIATAFLATRIDPKDTIEQLTPIEFKENEVSGPDQ